MTRQQDSRSKLAENDVFSEYPVTSSYTFYEEKVGSEWKLITKGEYERLLLKRDKVIRAHKVNSVPELSRASGE